MGTTWIPWKQLATPKCLEGGGILNLATRMMGHRIVSLEDMCVQLWIFIVQYLIEKDGVTRGRMVIKASQWQLLNN